MLFVFDLISKEYFSVWIVVQLFWPPLVNQNNKILKQMLFYYTASMKMLIIYSSQSKQHFQTYWQLCHIPKIHLVMHTGALWLEELIKLYA